MRWFRFGTLLIFFTIVQAGVLTRFNIKPDFFLILMVFFALFSNPKDAIITSFAIGFAADLTSGAMGSRMLSYLVIGTALSQLNRFLSVRNLLSRAFVIFITFLVTALLSYFLTYLKEHTSQNGFFANIFYSSLYSAVVGSFLFSPIAWWMQVKSKRFGKW